MRRLVSKDPFSGISTWYQSHGDGTFTVEHTQDVEQNLEFNKAEANSGWDGAIGDDKNFKRVAHIPNVIVLQMMSKGINVFDKNDTKWLHKFLNSSENRDFRTHFGRL